MTTTTPVESPLVDESTLSGRAADALRHAAHLSHEARLLKTVAADAVEDAVHSAKRTIKQARQGALDARDELTYRVKREPLKAAALMFAAGAVVGAVLVLAGNRLCRRATNRTS